MRGSSAVAALVWIAGASPLAAATAIGEATEVVLNTSVDRQGARRTVARGDAVSAQDTINTDDRGKAAFRFVDDTRLSVGPNSSVRLDKFVFDADDSPSSFVIRASRGLLRFSTGHGDHEAYRIQTPAATIGVRGTRFDVKVEGQEVRVSVSDGEVVLCPNRGRAGFVDCVEAKAGSSILSGRTRARVVPTSSLPQIRADALLPLPALANVLPVAPGLSPGRLLNGAPGRGVRQATDAAGDNLRNAGGAVRDAAGGLGNATGAVGNVGGAIGGGVGNVGGALGNIGGAAGGAIGGVGGLVPRLGR